MKAILFILLFCTAIVSANAQTMSFEETVKYINEKCDKDNDGKTFLKADKQGNVLLSGGEKFNLFEFYNARHYKDDGKDENEDFKDGFEIESYGIYQSSQRGYQLTFNLDKNNSIFIYRFSNATDVKRVFKAFLHLRSLCTHVKDPFD